MFSSRRPRGFRASGLLIVAAILMTLTLGAAPPAARQSRSPLPPSQAVEPGPAVQDKNDRPTFRFIKAGRQMNKIMPLHTSVHEFTGYRLSGFLHILTIGILIIEDYQ